MRHSIGVCRKEDKMSGRNQNNRPARSIRGPQSALTDFLASHNISANQIQLDHQRRRNQAQTAQDPNNTQQDGGDPSAAVTAAASPAEAAVETTADRKAREKEEKRKKDQQKALEKIKASKKFQKRKKLLDNSDEEEELARQWLGTINTPAPGQMENCAICGKRFTVTPYSRAAPQGGLLCNPCGKDLDKDDGGSAKKKKKTTAGGPVGRRRKMQSNILDGTYHIGARSLMNLCIDTLAKNIALAEDLGDLPAPLVDRIARILSKRRLLDPNTLELFLQPKAEDVHIYDGAKLSSENIMRIFQVVPKIKNLKIRNAIQFKDEVMDYVISRDNINLEGFYLHGANLVSETHFIKYLKAKGQSLRSFKIYYTDKHFGNEAVTALKEHAPALNRLKICHNQEVSGDGVREIAELKQLQHLSLDLHKSVHSDVYVHVLKNIGAGLKTLSLKMVPEIDNTVLDAIHANCRSLEKLRITDSEVMTDEGFARLFNDWENPGLITLDLQKCRQLDSAHPRANPDNLGLCSNGFRALMEHSGRTLRHLNIHACRHISREAFEEVFSAQSVYPDLRDLEISFCEEVTDFIVGSIFRSCPYLREMNVFGCMKVKDVRVPRGKILVGVPNAVGMQIDGDA
ncbi:putative dna repair protein [Phaeoacremonium minimum UCRPA7]|uniref:Putative dna repair protein n=1 Tax=Phaeoacremonium minimum (strain UCR-PA7) TaxID=1286976 RepID=R8BEI4_PHAM7|nr:putative dna repair protein [Phaeoacremonium minimum UCRPA7]EON97695.1 putative dna repair protein [Phaeoacremonium minimum UCRPA7]